MQQRYKIACMVSVLVGCTVMMGGNSHPVFSLGWSQSAKELLDDINKAVKDRTFKQNIVRFQKRFRGINIFYKLDNPDTQLDPDAASLYAKIAKRLHREVSFEEKPTVTEVERYLERPSLAERKQQEAVIDKAREDREKENLRSPRSGHGAQARAAQVAREVAEEEAARKDQARAANQEPSEATE